MELARRCDGILPEKASTGPAACEEGEGFVGLEGDGSLLEKARPRDGILPERASTGPAVCAKEEEFVGLEDIPSLLKLPLKVPFLFISNHL